MLFSLSKIGVVGLLSLFFLAACSDDKSAQTAASDTPLGPDSTALHLAVVSTADCRPFIEAERRGLYRRMGLNLRLETFASQMDCDTAMWSGWADVAYADHNRLTHRASLPAARGESAKWRELQPFTSQWSLVASGKLRLKKAAQLRGRTIATARFATSELVANAVIKEAGIKDADTYRAQINELRLRADMLKEGQVDAAVLPAPYAEQAINEGGTLIAKQTVPAGKGNFLAVRKAFETKSGAKQQIELLMKGYRMAVDSIKSKQWKLQ